MSGVLGVFGAHPTNFNIGGHTLFNGTDFNDLLKSGRDWPNNRALLENKDFLIIVFRPFDRLTKRVESLLGGLNEVSKKLIDELKDEIKGIRKHEYEIVFFWSSGLEKK